VTSYSWSPLEEKGPPPEPKKKTRSFGVSKTLLQHLGISVLVSLVLVAVFGAAGMAPRPLWFVAAALAVGFGTLAIRRLLPDVLETSWPGRHEEKLAAMRTRSNDNRTQFIATWIQEAGRERRAGEGSQTFVRRVRPLLLELTADRLRHRHGIDLDSEPERARALTGEQLWFLISNDDKRTASLAEIEAAIDTIENL
jgi:hypothetical protein